ncbi:MAG: hypothetical protein R3F59_31095 [Myxococcota bacterium]
MELVELVDGLPLGIELAAFQAANLGPGEVVRALRSQAKLACPFADRPARHTSLDAMVSWSWDRLSTRSRRVLADLQLFVDAVDLTVLADVTPPEADDPPLYETIAELVECGLLHRRMERGKARFTLYHVVRAYLTEHPPSQQAVERYVAALRAVAERAMARWDGIPRPAIRTDDLDGCELLHAAGIALVHAVEGAGPLVVCALYAASDRNLDHVALDLSARAEVAALDPVHRTLVLDHRQRTLQRLDRTAEAAAIRAELPERAMKVGRPDLAVFFTVAAALTALNAGEASGATEAFERAASWCIDVVPHCTAAVGALLASAVDSLAGALAFHREDPSAIAAFQRARAGLEQASLHRDALSVRQNLCSALNRFDRPDESERGLREIAAELDPEADVELLAVTHAKLALALVGQHRDLEAAAALDHALAMLASRPNLALRPFLTCERAFVAIRLGEVETAERFVSLALRFALKANDKRTEVSARVLQARVAALRELPEADDLFEASIERATESGLGRSAQLASFHWIQLLVARGRLAEALEVTDQSIRAPLTAALAPNLAEVRAELCRRLGRPTPAPGGTTSSSPLVDPELWARVHRARAALGAGDAATARGLVACVPRHREDELLNLAVADLLAAAGAESIT